MATKEQIMDEIRKSASVLNDYQKFTKNVPEQEFKDDPKVKSRIKAGLTPQMKKPAKM